MTRPITPNEGIHHSAQQVPPSPFFTAQQLEAWAAQLPLAMTKYLAKAILTALEAVLPPALTGLIEDAQVGLADVEAAVGTALTQIPGGNLVGALNTAITVAGTDIGTLLQYLNSSGQFNAAELIGALNTAVTYTGHALSTVLGGIEAATGDFVGTVTGTVDAAATIGSTVASVVESNAANALSDAADIGNAIENAAAGTLGSLGTIGTQVQTGFTNILTGLYNNLVPPSTPPVSAASQAQVNAAAAAIQQRLATIGNGGEEIVDIEFSAYSNGALPSIFTPISTTGSGITINSGRAYLTGTTQAQSVRYNATTTLGDYQKVSGRFSTMTGSNAYADLRGRMNASGNIYVAMAWSNGTSAWTGSGSTWALQFWNGGSNVALVTFTDTFDPTADYDLMCGDPSTSSPYRYQLLKNGTPLPIAQVILGDTAPVGQLYYDDTSHLSTVGASNRSGGFDLTTGGIGASGTVALDYFKLQDTAVSQPTVFVSASEATSSSTYTKLPTTSDEVAVNVGESGKVLISLDANSSSANGFASIAVSGANTIAASDDNAAAGNAGAIHSTLMFGGLSPGITLFNAEYRSSSGSVTFSRRRLTALAL